MQRICKRKKKHIVLIKSKLMMTWKKKEGALNRVCSTDVLINISSAGQVSGIFPDESLAAVLESPFALGASAIARTLLMNGQSGIAGAHARRYHIALRLRCRHLSPHALQRFSLLQLGPVAQHTFSVDSFKGHTRNDCRPLFF